MASSNHSSRYTRLMILPLVLLAASSVCCAVDLDDLMRRAQAAYSKGDYANAFENYTQAAVLGSAVALFQLGAMHERGEGITKDVVEAAKWYDRAAVAGSVSAIKRLANMYYDGEGVPKDFERADALYRRAGQLGDGNALFTLGQIYWIGSGDHQRNPIKATELFARAAERGNPRAL